MVPPDENIKDTIRNAFKEVIHRRSEPVSKQMTHTLCTATLEFAARLDYRFKNFPPCRRNDNNKTWKFIYNHIYHKLDDQLERINDQIRKANTVSSLSMLHSLLVDYPDGQADPN